LEGLLEKKEKNEGERVGVGVGDGREDCTAPVGILGRRTEEVLLE
jgi:hypothetical protein